MFGLQVMLVKASLRRAKNSKDPRERVCFENAFAVLSKALRIEHTSRSFFTLRMLKFAAAHPPSHSFLPPRTSESRGPAPSSAYRRA